MKKILFLILVYIMSCPVQSQVWEQISTPYDYIYVSLITSMNDDIYVNRFDPKSEKSHNYKYHNNEWVRAEDDTLYEHFGTLYLIEQNANKILTSCREGIFRSFDFGENWVRIEDNKYLGSKVKDFEISNYNYYVVSIAKNELFKLNTDLNDWELVKDVKKDTTLDLYIQGVESNSTHIFAFQQKVNHPVVITDTLEGGLYISNDEGNSWEKTLVDSSLYSLYANDDFLLVSTSFGNIMRSEDNGKTWTTLNIGATVFDYFDDGDRILASSNIHGIIESKDKGKSWQSLKQVPIQSKVYKKDNKYFFLGFGNLVYETSSTFEEINRTNLIFPNSRVSYLYSINDTLLSVGSFNRGVQYSTDSGNSWNTYFPLFENNVEAVSYLRKKDNQVYCKVPYAIYASTDYGKTFVNNFLWGEYLDLLILEDKILLYGNKGHVISKDYGKTFSMIDTTVLKNDYKLFKIAKTKNGDLLAFSQFDGVFKSTDNADTWTKLVDSLPNDTTFLSINDFYEFGENYYAVNYLPPRILKSTDEGKTWESLEIELFKEIQYFYLDMIDENTIILSSYGDGLKGIRISTDQGKTWKQVDNQPPQNHDDPIPFRIIGSFGNYIYATDGPPKFKGQGSLFRTSIEKLGKTTNIESEIERNYLYTYPPYPNPAKSEVKILFYWDINLPMSTDDINIYDLSGKKV
ncbi:MAG: hypothetical protein KDC55_12850, partial [Ignavibacteriae bacterium]|nr:hypothetical protein [Ignavibacteriota bacterium]